MSDQIIRIGDRVSFDSGTHGTLAGTAFAIQVKARSTLVSIRADRYGVYVRDIRDVTKVTPPTVTPAGYAGLRSYAMARSTGTHVGIYAGDEAGMDTEGGRWQTVCEEHGSVISHLTLAFARRHSSCPEEWCEGCQRCAS